MNIKIKSLPLGILGTNCYIIHNDHEALIFDPGGDEDQLIKFLNDNKLNPIAILLTHAHFDHIGAVEPIRNEYGIKVYMHSLEKDWLTNPDLNGSSRYPFGPISTKNPPDSLVGEGTFIIGDFTFDIYHTPGHSPGSVSYYFANEDILIAGDTLFQSSIGRTDLPFGNHDQLISSIKNKIFSLPNHTNVYPGHGPSTTIEFEKQYNPFL